MAVFTVYPTDLMLFFGSSKIVLFDNIYCRIRFAFWDGKMRDILVWLTT